MPLRKLYLELTDRCNLNCTICYRQSWDTDPIDMQPAVYTDLVETIRANSALKTVVLGGIGEPTGSPLFSTVLEDLKDCRIIVTTNGIFDSSLVPAIATCADTVVISMDGLPETFQKIRGTTPEILLANLNALVEMKRELQKGPQILLQCVLSADNMQDALSLVDLAADLGTDGLIFSHLVPQVAVNKDKILYSLYENPVLKTQFNQLRLRSLMRGVHMTLPYLSLKTERFCSFIEDDAAFACASGDIVPCYRLSHNYTEYVFGRCKAVHTYAFGNLATQNLIDIWESEAYHLYRERIRNGRYPSCIDCDLVDGCDYICSSDADCWCNTPSCADCIWSRRLVLCP